ncbi:class I SAM-dependent methyltransferase [Candidatus Gracilibacteria bacterium]|jgi:SAM-dependent methyltransferase|nr:class I SAM-dependent methyltransferase [Candidatus Gracilibacteria bacterium]NJM89828.1 class I SAM-dependent methyltransferase [Hydrococcus sp. RU_2_2]NJP20644.1 class I SAM-dependent methyltransferase [Hydrococcus sp. CRU_1_1]NJQ97547.1 class I SAM-dependent methyltransferase [Hydrococcus sp. CSU_1_8]
MSEEILQLHKVIWKKKPILRVLYTRWYKEIAAQLVSGNTLELGGGSGNFKEFAPNVTSTDIVPLPWIDVVADAQDLPFPAQSFDNLVMFDVLHHIENVSLFFDEALRVLRPGGRLAIMEPYISLASWPIYHFVHPEPVNFKQDPLKLVEPSPNRQPFDSNQAFATILFERKYKAFKKKYPQFRKTYHRRMAFFAYPLSGGFDKPSMLPMPLLKPVLALENSLSFMSRFLAFRILVILEKQF